MSELLFVYGTLKQGFGNNRVMRASKDADGKAIGDSVFLCEASLPGYEMYSLGGFPAIVPTEDKNSVVIGELWRVVSANQWRNIDALEGCRNGGIDEGNMYNRIKVKVMSKELESIQWNEAYTYVWNGGRLGSLVPSGKW